MRFVHRFRRPISFVALAGMMSLTIAAPAAAYYNPQLGRWVQPDPNGTGLVLAPGLRYHGANPTVTVSMAYQLQFGDGMNFYEFLRSNPATNHDPTGLFSLTDFGISSGVQGDMTGMYADMGASMVDALKGIALLQSERSAVVDDVIDAASYDFSGIDRALAVYDGYQAATLGVFFGSVGGKLAGGVIGAGRRAWSYFAGRAGGRANLLGRLSDGTSSLRRFHGMDGAGLGEWTDAAEHMSPRAAAYQQKISGRGIGQAYVFNGVSFDGFQSGVLIEAKGPGYAHLRKQSFGKSVIDKMVAQADRQVKAQGRYPIEWHVAEHSIANELRTIFQGNRWPIKVIHTPP